MVNDEILTSTTTRIPSASLAEKMSPYMAFSKRTARPYPMRKCRCTRKIEARCWTSTRARARADRAHRAWVSGYLLWLLAKSYIDVLHPRCWALLISPPILRYRCNGERHSVCTATRYSLEPADFVISGTMFKRHTKSEQNQLVALFSLRDLTKIEERMALTRNEQYCIISFLCW